jgi:hypothetical protein
MAVSEQTGFDESTASGMTGVFPYTFKILRAQDMRVEIDGVLIDGLGAYTYEISGIGEDSGGNVTITPNPTAGAIVLRALDSKLDRTTNYQYAGDLKSPVVNADFDRLWLAMQLVKRRALMLPLTEIGNNVLSAGPSARANKALIFDENGAPVVSRDNYNDQAANAALSAAQALASKNAAAISAAEAEESASRVDLGALDQAVTDSTAQAVIATTQAGIATTEAGNSTAAKVAAQAAQALSEAARDAALLSRGLWQNTAQGIGNGVAGTASLVAGSGGTNGTFALAFSGGTQVIAPKGYFVVAGGVVTQVAITYAGHYSAGTPTLSFAASAGLSGASATAVMGANTPVDAYFSVPVAGSNDSLILYKVVTGPVATEITRYPSSAQVTAIANKFPDVAPEGYAWSILDAGHNAAIGVKDDGTFVAKEMEVTKVKIEGLDASQIESSPHFGYAVVVEDGEGKAAVGVKLDGTFVAKDIEVTNINGAPYSSSSASANIVALRGGVYSHQINFINNAGQSLGEGSTPATSITTTQEYDNLGFPARANSPSSFVPLTVANTQVIGRAESPMYGTLGHIKELIEKEQGISYTDNPYQLVGCNNAYSGSSITTLNKGTARYDYSISQVLSAYTLAGGMGKTMAFQAVTWTQGENPADTSMGKDAYKALLKQLAIDYNNDGKAITGQFNDVAFITYQTNTVDPADRGTAIAQLEASNESSLISMACPMYQFTYGDTLHITAESSKWLGGYYGLVYKRVVIDRQEWKPLQPIGHSISGNSIDLIFNKTGLVLDATLIPAQTNSGFDVVDGGGSPVTVSSVAVISPNRVRITLAAPPASGYFVRYGFNTAVGKSPFFGGCGNLRDSQGDFLVYEAISKPMHNWCVFFNYSI